MSTKAIARGLGVLLGISIIALAAESAYLWNAHDKLQRDDAQEFTTVSPRDDIGPMSLDPASEFARMQKQMNRMMNQMSAGNPIFSQRGFGLSPQAPRISMHEDADKYTVEVDVPEGKDVELNTDVENNLLTIDGRVEQDGKSRSNGHSGQSLAISQFSQTMTLPDPVDESGVRVQRDQGRIVITVPKVG